MYRTGNFAKIITRKKGQNRNQCWREEGGGAGGRKASCDIYFFMTLTGNESFKMRVSVYMSFISFNNFLAS